MFDLFIENFNLGYILWLASTRVLTFYMSVFCDKTFPWVPKIWPCCLTYLINTLTLAISFEWHVSRLIFHMSIAYDKIFPWKQQIFTLTLVFDLLIDWLIDYLRFYVPLKNISLVWRHHHCWWRAAKFRPMLSAQGLRAGRDLYCATPAVTRNLGFSGLIRRTAPFSRLLVDSYDTRRDVEDLF
jgi:hypothetical protein